MRQSLGIAVFSGMIGVTLFGIVLTPVFFFLLGSRARPRRPSLQPDQLYTDQAITDGRSATPPAESARIVGVQKGKA
jgi:hypothetical protein